MRGRTFVWMSMCGALAALPMAAQEDAPRGERLYNAHCSWCHGVGGEGGEGPVLTFPRLRLAPDRETLSELILNGSPRNGMPGVFSLNPEERGVLAAYVLSLGRVEVVDLPGDPVLGRGIYAAQKCDSCHIVAGEGVGVGPELSEIGLRRAPEHLRESLLRPEAKVAEEYRVMTVTTADRDSVRGIRIREDPFTVVIRDADNRIRSFRTADVRDVRRRMDASVMPTYERRLSEAEIDHLVAYLAGLRGE